MKIKIPEFSSFFIKKKEPEVVNKISDFDIETLDVKKVFLSWQILGRSEKSNIASVKFTRTFTIIGVFVGLVLVAMQEYFLILAIGSLIFITQALAKASPEVVKYELSSHGLLIDETLYYWNQLRRYFFIKRDGAEVLAIDTTLGFPGRVFISFKQEDKDKIKTILDQRLFFLEEEPKTFLDTTYDKFIDKFNIKDES